MTIGLKQRAYRDARKVVESNILHHPRSLQKEIGPSEIGTDCQRCLAAKLAGWPEEREVAWLPAIGTAMHAQLAEWFEAVDEDRYLSEHRVNVGQIGETEIWGSSDLFDKKTGTVIDFKVVGAGTLKSAKDGPSDQYRVQAHLYGRGFVKAGFKVNEVAIWYMPRNYYSLDGGVFWHEPWDEDVAIEALANANELLDEVLFHRALGEEVEFIESLPRASKCWDCDRLHSPEA